MGRERLIGLSCGVPSVLLCASFTLAYALGSRRGWRWSTSPPSGSG
jgi:hypothetical protein